MGRGYQFLLSVPQAAANTFSIGAVIRSDRVLAQLGHLLNEPGRGGGSSPSSRPSLSNSPASSGRTLGRPNGRGPGRLVLEELAGLARRPLLVADRFRGPGYLPVRPAPGRSGPDG